MSAPESSGATLRNVQVLTADGLRWTAQAVSVTAFEITLKNYRAINVGPPGGASPNGWRVATAHVVAWRLNDD